MNQNSEEWRDCPQNNFYQISSLGSIRSKGGIDKIGRKIQPKILKSNCINSKGYATVQLRIGLKINQSPYFTIHRLVATAFLENPKGLPQINHKDSNKLNNKLENLEWCDNQFNQQHALKNNLRKSSINLEKANELREIYNTTKISQKKIAEMFGISQQQVSKIIRKERWNFE